MTESEKRMHRCAFAGHRPERLGISREEACRYLQREILAAYEDGINVFISGMARGIDLWAAESVLCLRQTHTDMKLICAVPFEGMERSWSAEERKEYDTVIRQADHVRYICTRYSPSCFQQRNMWMIDRVSRLIAIWDGSPSGTENAVTYACRSGVSIFIYIYHKCITINN